MIDTKYRALSMYDTRYLGSTDVNRIKIYHRGLRRFFGKNAEIFIATSLLPLGFPDTTLAPDLY